MIKLKVLVDGGGGGVALTVIRSLGRKGIQVIASARNKHAISFYSRYCRGHFQYPPPIEEPKEFIERMLNQVKKEEYDALFTLGGREMWLISEHRDRFLPYTKIPLVKHETLLKADNKAETLKTAIKNDIPCPQTYFVEGIDDVKNIKDEIEFPVVIKPNESSGSKGLRYVSSEDELIPSFKELSEEFSKLIIQECIPPGGGAYGLEALFNKDSKPRAIFVHKRLREYPITGGPSTFREGVKHPEVERLGIKLLKALDWYGLAMVEFRIDPRDGKPKLMEINPRFWGSLPLAIASGVNFPYLLYRMSMYGDIDPVLDYRTGIKARWLLYGDFKYLLHVMRGHSTKWGYKSPSRIKTLIDFLKFYEKDVVYDFLAWDDPKPTLLKLISPVANWYLNEKR